MRVEAADCWAGGEVTPTPWLNSQRALRLLLLAETGERLAVAVEGRHIVTLVHGDWISHFRCGRCGAMEVWNGSTSGIAALPCPKAGEHASLLRAHLAEVRAELGEIEQAIVLFAGVAP